MYFHKLMVLCCDSCEPYSSRFIITIVYISQESDLGNNHSSKVRPIALTLQQKKSLRMWDYASKDIIWPKWSPRWLGDQCSMWPQKPRYAGPVLLWWYTVSLSMILPIITGRSEQRLSLSSNNPRPHSGKLCSSCKTTPRLYEALIGTKTHQIFMFVCL